MVYATNYRPANDQPNGRTYARPTRDGTRCGSAFGPLQTKDAVRSRLKRGTLRTEKGDDGTIFVVLSAEGPTDQPAIAAAPLAAERPSQLT